MLKLRLWNEKNYFSTPPYQSFSIPIPQDKNMAPTSAHVKKESNSTLKYAPMVTPTQEYN